MSKQVFVADTILTASAMNTLQGNDYNQTVSTKTASYTLVAADVGTKIVMNSASATTITVNTSLFSAGDTLTILNIAAGVCTVTAGTATVSTTGSLALAQNGGGTLYFTSAGVSVFQADGVTASPSGLVCVKAETAFTAVSSVTLDSIFTSTYTNYQIVWRLTASGNIDMSFKLRVGAVTSSTGYNFQRIYGDGTTTAGDRSASQTSFLMGGANGAFFSQFTAQLFSPFVAEPTNLTIDSGTSNGAYTSPYLQIIRGNHSVATAHDGFIFAPSSGTITGVYTVYGYAKAV